MENQLQQAVNDKASPWVGRDTRAGLVNSQEALERVQRLVESAAETGVEHAVCYIDLDDFRRINERGGWDAGDWVLSEVGARLHRHVRPGDTIARMGSDEFAVIMKRTPLLDAILVARAIRDDLAGWRFVCGKEECALAVSVGVVPIVRDSSDAVEVLAAADAASRAAREGFPRRLRVAAGRGTLRIQSAA